MGGGGGNFLRGREASLSKDAIKNHMGNPQSERVAGRRTFSIVVKKSEKAGGQKLRSEKPEEEKGGLLHG